MQRLSFTSVLEIVRCFAVIGIFVYVCAFSRPAEAEEFEVQLVALTKGDHVAAQSNGELPDLQWWSPNGEPVTLDKGDLQSWMFTMTRHLSKGPIAKYTLLGRIVWPRNAEFGPLVPPIVGFLKTGTPPPLIPMRYYGSPTDAEIFARSAQLPEKLTSVDVDVVLAVGEWQTVAAWSVADQKWLVGSVDIDFRNRFVDEDKKTFGLYTTRIYTRRPARLSVIGRDNQTHELRGPDFVSGGYGTHGSNLTKDEIKEIRYEVRNYRNFRFENVSLRLGQTTQTKVTELRPPEQLSTDDLEAGERRLFLPHTDRRLLDPKAQVVLDLKSGELLPFPVGIMDPIKILEHFEEVDKGDLLFSDCPIFINGSSANESSNVLHNTVNCNWTIQRPGKYEVWDHHNNHYEMTIEAVYSEGMVLRYRAKSQ